MNSDMNKLAISCEDQEAVAKRLLKAVPSDIKKEFVPYKTKTGRSRTPQQVAESIFEISADYEALTAILVDLVKDPQCHNIDFGLTVIREFSAIARQEENVSELLLDQNFLTIVVSNFEPKQDHLLRVWGDQTAAVQIRIVRNKTDVEWCIKNKPIKPILPVVDKLNHEMILPSFLNGWFSSRIPA